MVDNMKMEIITLPAKESVLGNLLPEIKLEVFVGGNGPAVVLSHGFPELAYSWRHQVQALIEAGFTVIAPNQRGYGGSDSPKSVSAFSMEHLTFDLVRLLDHFKIEKAVFIGHDWGGAVVWTMPIAYPERVLGVIGVNTPYLRSAKTKQLRKVFPNDEDFYMLWFQQEHVPEKAMDPYVRKLFDLMMRVMKPKDAMASLQNNSSTRSRVGNPFFNLAEMEVEPSTMLSKEEIDVYEDAFVKSGFRGGISWYRNLDINAEQFPDCGRKHLEVPCMMITAEWDMALPPAMAAGMPALIDDLEMEMIKECGHWTQQEKPDELNTLMIDWLNKKFK